MLGTIWNTLIYLPLHNVLTYVYVLTGSLGISVFIIIVLVRILLWPMVAKQYRDTKKIRSLQPRLDELKEKYKNDPQGLAKAQQAVYKEVNYNPLGCVTNFAIQIPIVAGLYQSVIAFTKHSPADMPGLYPFVQTKLNELNLTNFATDLLGVQLLTSPTSHFANGFFTLDSLPYILLLAILIGANVLPTWVSMKVMNTQVPKIKKQGTKTDEENMQEAFTSSMTTSTMYIMPIMMTLTMAPLPSVVAVYMIVQNVVTTVQQIIVKYLHDITLKKKLIAVMVDKYKTDVQEATKNAEKLLKLSNAVNFLADELGEFGIVKTTSTKVHDITFERVLSRKKDVVNALLTFDQMARNPEKAEEILKK